MQWQSWLKDQKAFFASGQTRPYAYRRQMLERLLQLLERYEKDLVQAVQQDFGKAEFEILGTEVLFIQNEIRETLRHLKSWMKPRPVATPLMLWPGRSRIYHEPYGQVLILAPWNYPIQLSLGPLVGAIAGGNVCVLKPSELTPHTSGLLRRMLHDHFPQELLCVIEGEVQVAQALLELQWDMIFLTGSPQVGKIVAASAARHLTPTVLELGGKSPFILDETADLKVSARRLAWGKFSNAGQTCVAPDYLLVHESVKAEFIKRLAQAIEEFYSNHPHLSRDYARIVNPRHFDRLVSLMNSSGRIIYGGNFERSRLFLSPTLIDQPDLDSPLMKEEIFGPLLPILSYKTETEIESIIGRNPKPLALYVFSKRRALFDRLRVRVDFGGGCWNDTLIHLGSSELPFGGIGTSGMGRYHGRRSFEAFTYEKGIMIKPFWGDLKLRYPPYDGKLPWLRRAFRFLM